MQKSICFSFIISLLTINCCSINAQQEKGQISVNIGVGYSPEFDGAITLGVLPYYNVATVFGYPQYSQAYSNGSIPYYNFSPITANLGGTIDFGLWASFSIGVAGSYQAEEVNWNPNTSATSSISSDKITRTNVALRLLYHFRKDELHKRFDSYIGIRLGNSYWHDIPSSTIPIFPLLQSQVTFIDNPNVVLTSFQVLYGLRFYIVPFIGINMEVGIGSPYLAEAGLTFKINTRKNKDAQSTPAQNSYGGHGAK